MTTAAEQYRALVAKLEEINDPRSQEERDAQMANFKGAYKDWEDAESEKAKATKPSAAPAQAAQPSPVSGDVKKIQTLLNNKGAQLAVDGKLGAQTLAAIVKHLEAEATPAQAAQPAAPAGAHEPFTVGQTKAAVPTDAWAKGGLFNR